MRALRVIRLFGRVKELRKMITAVSASIFAMMNAFVILVIMLCICEGLDRRLNHHYALILDTACAPAHFQNRNLLIFGEKKVANL